MKSRITIVVYNMIGQKVRTLVEGLDFSEGRHVVPFDGGGLSSGFYVCRVYSTDGTYRAVRKMLLMK